MKRSRSLLIANVTLALCLVVCIRVAAQGDLVKTDGFTSPLHRANVGRIIFTAKSVPVEILTPANFITTTELRDTADFSLRAFMGNSLTNYLHNLQPELSVDELNRQANYQFSFYIDDALVHQENLNPVWVRAENKIKQTTLG